MKRNLALLAALALLPIAAASQAAGQAIVSTGGSFVEPRLLIGARHDDGVREAGVELAVKEGWKTYWRSPGEAGVPPSFDWSGSSNLASVEVDWPVPEVFDSFGLRAVGYSGTVVLPLRLVPQDPERPISLDLDLTLGVCREICVLEEAELEAEIAPDAPDPAAAKIAAARAAMPRQGREAGVERVACRITGTGEDRAFRATVEFDRPLSDPYVVLEAAGRGWFHGTTTAHSGGQLEVSSTLSLPPNNAWVDRSGVRMTVLDGDLAADVQGCSAG